MDDVFTDTLNAIASEPDEDHVFYVNDFDELLDLVDDIVTAVSHAGAAATLYDIQSIGPGGSVIYVRAVRTLDGQMVVISWQEQ